MPREKPQQTLRRGWTTGACATAATKAALTALLTGRFPDPVEITLPKGERVSFALAREDRGADWAQVGIIKDAGDDPDVTHGAMVMAKVWLRPEGVTFAAGEGVGTVTKPGLPVPVGEPAINPVPRQMMTAVAAELGTGAEIEISIPGGAALAGKTWNPRLGIVGGLSILGTTGIVNPFSCAAWIASIHRGIDVARAIGLSHVAGCTGSTSEDAVRARFGLPLEAMLDMGDFAGGVLKYLRLHPVPRLTIGGGFGKMTKLAQGHMDLHSGRSQVDFTWLAERVAPSLRQEVLAANTAQHVLEMAGPALAEDVAVSALAEARKVLGDAPVVTDLMIVDRAGKVIAHAA
ncbi:cobalt-precorrin-5B (C(1))-methyltransferase [Aestuariivirga sp.]|uniref:cobalt-precorrin-5B (C(1))-methyltransferase n=1 Tax=Aestuariivirga sp. TaxID=2650926 RepID=UPI0039E47635